MKKLEILQEAQKTLNQRAETHGEAKQNMKMIAMLWSGYLGFQIFPKDVAIMNILQKVARTKGSSNTDNPVDIAGYAGILGEVME